MERAKQITFILQDTSIKGDTIAEALNSKFVILKVTDESFLIVNAKQNLNHHSPPQQLLLFKEKEKLVIEELAKGMTYEQVAENLGISINGVRFYVKKIYRLLGVKNAREAVSKYYYLMNE